MSTCLNAPVLASKGHFFMFSEEMVAKKTLAVILDSHNKPIIPNEENDETFLGIEKTAGICLEAL
jgi:hypothetical protein